MTKQKFYILTAVKMVPGLNRLFVKYFYHLQAYFRYSIILTSECSRIVDNITAKLALISY